MFGAYNTSIKGTAVRKTCSNNATRRRAQNLGRAQFMYERKARYERRRAHERKRNLMILVSGFCLALTFAFLFGSFLSKAETRESDTVYYKYYTNVEVQSGDTLWSLAEVYMDENYASRDEYIREVKQVNHLSKGDTIVSGEYLILPYYSTEYK